MTNKLHIANLAPDTTEDSLRAHFGACGGVCNVEIMTDGGRPTGFGSVTMTNTHFTMQALARLDGADFLGRPIRVTNTRDALKSGPRPTTKIAQQYRERHNMTYELDCNGAPLTLRIFPMLGEHWRIDARASDADDAFVASSRSASRTAALTEVILAWNANAKACAQPPVDADAVITAMVAVRAV
jgi:RNA recognition motif-containing protein